MTNERTTGLDLKVARTLARIKAKQIADEMGVSPSRVAAVEREAVVSAEMVRRYLAALETCRTHGTPASAA